MSVWLVLAALWLPQQDTVGVSVQLSQQRVSTGEVVVYDVTIMTPGGTPDDIRLPQFAGGLSVEGTRRYDEYAIRYPGGRVRTTRLEVHLRPRRPGRYAIAPVVVTYDGRRHASRALVLEVLAALPRAQQVPGTAGVPGFNPYAVGPDAEALLRARLEPDTVWVGQQATLVVEALISNELRGRLRRAPEYLTPSVSGMWTQDLPDVAGARIEWSGPQRYEVQTFRRAYFPLEPGTFAVPEARLIYEARRGFLFTPYTENLMTAPLPLTVRPLPAEGVPASFGGAVGDYSLSATIAPANLAVGDAALLTVVVRGTGNLKALPAPRVPARDVHLDTPTEDADVEGVGGVAAGTKTFTWVVVPERAGTLELGPIEYAFFDPAAGEYRVATTAPLTIEVAPADPAAGQSASEPPALRPLRATPRTDSFRFLRGPLLGALTIAPLALALGGLLLWRRRERARVAPSTRTLRRRLNARLATLAEADAIAAPEFFARLEEAVREWLADRYASPSLRAATGAGLTGALEGAGMPGALASSLRDLLDRIARAPFQPTLPPVDERARLLERVRETVDRADRVSPAALGGRVTVALVAALALAAPASGQGPTSAPAPARAGQAAAPRLSDVVSAYEDGRLVDATNAARAYTRAHPRDASGWYDLGTIETRRGNRGVATLALLRALVLDPRAADIRHNLDVLDVDDAGRRAVAPALPLRPGEMRALALAAWWLTILLGGVAILIRSRRWAFAGATTLALTLVLAGLALAPGLAADVAVPLGPSVQLRGAPHLRAEARGPAEEGSLLRVIERRDAWLRVRDRDGQEGWLERRDVGIIGGERR